MPPPLLRRLRRALWIVLATGLVGLLYVLHLFGPVAAGYAASVAALVHYGTGQPLEDIERERLVLPFGLGNFVTVDVLPEQRLARSTAFGIYTREAHWREGSGATREGGPELPWPEFSPLPLADAALPWPRGSAAPTDSVPRELAQAIETAFLPGSHTHAVLVTHQGRLVAERYAPGFDPSTPILGWSLSKTLLAVLAGRAADLDRLPELEAPAPVPEWQGGERADITLEQLLRMTSGLEFWSNYSLPWSDSLQMLFVSLDFPNYTAARTLRAPAGSTWSYCDGTSNLLARIVGEAVGSDLGQRARFLREEFFRPMGMSSAVLPVDPGGTWVGSSFAMASARDWARLGQLILDDGLLGDERFLPEGWVDFMASRTEASPHGCFGAHLWRYDAESGRMEDGSPFPPELAGMVYAAGFGGQVLLMDRERDLQVLRLGAGPSSGRFPRETFAARVVRSMR